MSGRASGALLLLLSSACAQSVVSSPSDGSGTPRDGGGIERDGGAPEADAAPDLDARAGLDAASLDAGPPVDAGAPDGGSLDAGPIDAGPAAGGPCMRSFPEDVQLPSPPSPAGFQGVRAFAFDDARRLYVLSRSGAPFVGWVTVLSPAPEHALVRTFGRDHLRAVHDLVVDAQGNVHVLDWDPDGIVDPVVHVYDAQGNFVRTWAADCNGQCDEAWSMARDATGRIYIGGIVVFRYDAQGTYLDSLGLWGSTSGRIGVARGLAYDPLGFLWVGDLVRNKVQQYDVATRSQVIEVGGRGVGPGLFDGDAASDWRWGPTRLALDARGAIYVNDPYVGRIQKLSRQGTFLGEFTFGNTMEIGPVAVEPASGHVYVGRGTAVTVVCAL